LLATPTTPHARPRDEARGHRLPALRASGFLIALTTQSPLKLGVLEQPIERLALV